MHRKSAKIDPNSATSVWTNPRPSVLNAPPQRIGEIAMLRGLGYSFREIAQHLCVTPQAASLMLARYRSRQQALGNAEELYNLSARAVSVLRRYGIRSREQAKNINLTERLQNERNCGHKTLNEILQWLNEDDTKS